MVGWEGKVNTVDGANEGGDGYSVQSDAELYECKLYEWFICGVCLVAQYKCTDREAQQKMPQRWWMWSKG